MKEKQPRKQKDALAMFPDLFKNYERDRTIRKNLNRKRKAALKNRVHKPLPPDIGWLHDETYGDIEEEDLASIPLALVLSHDEKTKNSVFTPLKDLGFRIEVAETSMEGLHKLSSFNYAAILMSTNFENKVSVADSTVHRYLCKLPQSRRRLMHYILIGPELNTLHYLQALALSANLVVNDTHLEYLYRILKQSFQDSEELFGPLIQVLEEYGRR